MPGHLRVDVPLVLDEYVAVQEASRYRVAESMVREVCPHRTSSVDDLPRLN